MSDLFVGLPLLSPKMAEHIAQAIENSTDPDVRETLDRLMQHFRQSVAQDYLSFEEYLDDCARFEAMIADEVDRDYYRHHDPHADMCADLPM